MTKSELIQKLYERFEYLSADEIKKVVDLVFDEMSDALVSKKRIEIRGFGAFSLRPRKARIARNPRTNEKISMGERFSTYFRPGKELKDKVNKLS
jgi:integration host factor subunit beta